MVCGLYIAGMYMCNLIRIVAKVDSPILCGICGRKYRENDVFHRHSARGWDDLFFLSFVLSNECLSALPLLISLVKVITKISSILERFKKEFEENLQRK
jgi:hypothetical protein